MDPKQWDPSIVEKHTAAVAALRFFPDVVRVCSKKVIVQLTHRMWLCVHEAKVKWFRVSTWAFKGSNVNKAKALAPHFGKIYLGLDTARQRLAAVAVGVIDVRAPLERDWRGSFGLDGSSPAGDGVHPTALGMRRIADAVWERLRPHLRPERRRLAERGGRRI